MEQCPKCIDEKLINKVGNILLCVGCGYQIVEVRDVRNDPGRQEGRGNQQD